MNTFLKPFVIGFVTTTALLLSEHAMAQDSTPDDVTGNVFAGVATIPRYEGAGEQQTIPLVAGEVRWANRFLALEGTALRANVLDSPRVELGPVVNLTFGRDQNIASAAVRALGEIDDAYEVGAFGSVNFGSVLAPGDQIKLRVQGLRDVSGVHEGWVGRASLSYRLPVSRRLLVTSEAAVQLANGRYARTYFSVAPEAAADSGLPAFEARGGIKDVGASLTAVYGLTGRMSLLGFAGYRRMLGDFRDSPVVAREGDANQFTAGAGLGFRF